MCIMVRDRDERVAYVPIERMRRLRNTLTITNIGISDGVEHYSIVVLCARFFLPYPLFSDSFPFRLLYRSRHNSFSCWPDSDVMYPHNLKPILSFHVFGFVFILSVLLLLLSLMRVLPSFFYCHTSLFH